MAAISNSLLAALPRKSYLRLLPGLAPVALVFGDVLYEPGKPIREVYFPSQSLVSLLTLVEGRLAKAACACYERVRDMRDGRTEEKRFRTP